MIVLYVILTGLVCAHYNAHDWLSEFGELADWTDHSDHSDERTKQVAAIA